MNRSRSQVRQPKTSSGPQPIPIIKWEADGFAVAMGSALPGGTTRDCALKSPAVIRGRPPGTTICPGLSLASRNRPSRPEGRIGRK